MLTDSERSTAITELLQDDEQKYGLNSAMLDKCIHVAGTYGRDLLNGLGNEGTLFNYLKLDGLVYESITLPELIAQIRQAERMVKGEKEIYPSRPLLTALTVRALVGDQMRLRAHLFINNSRDDATVARFYGLCNAGHWVNEATFSIDRAEGTLKIGPRAEVLSMFKDPTKVFEQDLTGRARRFEDYANKLIRDNTGILTIQSSLVNSVTSVYGPSVLAERSSPNLSLEIAGKLLALKAYERIYERIGSLHS